MAKKDLKNEIRHEDDEIKVKPKKKKMTANDKRKLIMKIVGWIMAISMICGSLIALFAPLMYK